MSQIDPGFVHAHEGLARALHGALSASPVAVSWRRAELTLLMVGAVHRSWLTVRDESGAELPTGAVDLPDLAGWWERLKRAAADPEHGTWLSATLTVDRDGTSDIELNHDTRVHAGDHEGAPNAPWPDGTRTRTPSASDWAREFAMYPRAAESMPAWAEAVLADAAPVQAVPLHDGPAVTDFAGLHSVADHASLYSALRSSAFDEYLATELDGEHDLEGDLERGVITFVGRRTRKRIDANATLIASVAPGTGSLLWGWAHPQGDPTSAVRALRDLGEQHGVRDLTTAELALPDDLHGDDLGRAADALARVAADAAVEATGVSPVITVPVGGGTVVVFQLTGIELPEPTFRDFALHAGSLLAETRMRDHRRGFVGLAGRRGWTLTWNGPERSAATMADGTSSVDLTFDPSGLTTGIQTRLQA